jgi:cytochrome c5
MRALLSLMLLTISLTGCQLAKSQAHAVNLTTVNSITPATKPNFDTEIKPIFQARCQPCHFQGGKVYDKMPFDKAETINRLGTKLFTRIKDEKEQRLIREFLDQP